MVSCHNLYCIEYRFVPGDGFMVHPVMYRLGPRDGFMVHPVMYRLGLYRWLCKDGTETGILTFSGFQGHIHWSVHATHSHLDKSWFNQSIQIQGEKQIRNKSVYKKKKHFVLSFCVHD